MNKTSLKMFLRNGLFLLMFFGSAVVLLQGCYPYDDQSPANSDVVATFYEEGTDFSALVTYALPDTVFELDSNGDMVPADINASTSQIINSINSNMQAYGFTVAAVPASADVYMLAVVTSSTWVSGGCYGGYYSWYYPYYGWCYPVAYTYTTGSILIVMSIPDANNPKTVWLAGCNGVVSGTVTNSRISSDINQAFNQSPYLGNGK